jgi:hypothetical protein
MAPTVGSSSSLSSEPTATSSRAVKIPHRNTLSEEQASGQSPRIREKGHKTSSRAEARLARGSLSDSSSPASYSAKASASEHATAGPSSSSSCSSSFENSLYDPASSISSSKLKAKSTTASRPNTLIPPHPSPLGPSMASSTSYRSINLNSDFDGTSSSPPHLITYTKTGQGFTWNEELFLPSYMMGRYEAGGGRRRRRRYEDDDTAGGDNEGVEIAEIFVSDEEARNMMP